MEEAVAESASARYRERCEHRTTRGRGEWDEGAPTTPLVSLGQAEHSDQALAFLASPLPPLSRRFHGCKRPPAIPLDFSSHLRTTSFEIELGKRTKTRSRNRTFFFFLFDREKKKEVKSRGSVSGVNNASSSLARCPLISLLLPPLLPQVKRRGLSPDL